MFTLALALGRTVAELEASLSSSEFTEWMRFYRENPFGTWRDNWHSAQIAALLFNANRGKQQPMKVADFMFMSEAESKQKADLEMLAALDAVAKVK